MAIVTKNEDGTYTEKTDPSLFENMLDGMKAPFLADNELLDSSSAFWASVGYAGLSAVGSSMYTRKRVREGKQPIGRVLF